MFIIGLSPETVHRDCRGKCLYEAEQDTHFPELTVHQTVEFAAKSKVAHFGPPNGNESHLVRYMTGAVLATFKIAHVAESKIGDDLIRGASGGERKRLTLQKLSSEVIPFNVGTTVPAALTASPH
ncbi:MAG: hypothetical protein Q9163_002570 [Psora crenata]